ncbi:MAG: hypothetical protein ACR2G7_03350 [Acidimicrobiales bacterium]
MLVFVTLFVGWLVWSLVLWSKNRRRWRKFEQAAASQLADPERMAELETVTAARAARVPEALALFEQLDAGAVPPGLSPP